MAAVSANIIHHQQQSGHAKVSQDDQSEEESNDGSLHSATREKHSVVSSPEYKAASPEKTLMNSFSSKSSDNTSKYVCTSKESGGRSPSGYDGPSETPNSHTQFNSSFSMHNVLKMKSERDSVSPSPIHCSNAGVFSTAKLLKNTPNYITKRAEVEMNPKNDESSCDASPKIRHEEEMDYREIDYNLRSSSPMESEEKSSRLDTSNLDEGNSCCSEGTVLSVGNEAQINSFDTENRTCSTANSTAMSPRSSPTPSPASSNTGNLQHLSSFKHIQSHLSAISQLNQSLHGSQHMLLRPNPITPNPLMFLNHNRLLFNPHLQIQGNVTPIEILHQSPRSLSNSPTSVNPALSTRLSPNDLSPSPSSNSHHLSPSPPELEAKVNLVQNIPGFAGLPSHIGQSLRFYKQNPFPAPTLVNMPPNVQALNDHFNKKIFQEDRMEGRKMHMKVLNLDKIGTMNNNSHNFNPGGVNERLLANNNLLSNNPNVTNNNPDLEDERHNIIINHNGLKFSIDNILKADFGRRITDPLHKRSKSSSSKHKFGGLLNPLSLAENSNKQVPLQHHNISETFGSSAFKKSAFQASKESESFFGQSKSCGPSNSFIQNSSLNSSSSSSGSSRVSSERLSTESRIPSGSELKSVTSLQNNLVSSSVGGGGGGGAEGQAAAAANPMDLSKADSDSSTKGDGPMVWPAWVYCTRYSDRPSSGPRTRKPKKQPGEPAMVRDEEKRPRTAFSGPQLARLKHEFAENRYLTERRRQQLSAELGLNEAQIKIWFQNKRAKIKKASGQKNPLALQLMAQGLYNHSTVPLTKEEEELQELHARETREAKA